MDGRFLMANLDIQWTNLSFGFPLAMRFIDNVEMSRSDSYRRTEAVIGGTLSWGMGNERRKISLNAGIGATLFARDPGDGSSAYTWSYDVPIFTTMTGVKLSNLRIFAWEHFGQGVSLSLNAQGRFPFVNTPFRYEAVFQGAFEPYFPLQLTLYGIFDKNGMNLQGISSKFKNASIAGIAATEYPPGELARLTWLSGGEAELKLFSINLQDNFSHIYFNRLFGTLAYRGAFYDGRDIQEPGMDVLGNVIGNTPYRLTQSLVFRFGGVLSTVIVTALPIRISPYLWGAWKISSLRDDRAGNDFMFGFNVSVSM
jgi:hypothetical protein